MPDDVVLAKAESIERCVARVRDVYSELDPSLQDDILRQDSILLNLQRACETAIDLAMHIVRRKQLGLPQETKQAFVLLKNVGLPKELIETMKRMVGFRNIAVHRYRALDLEIVEEIIATKLDGILAFSAFAVQHFAAN